ncbi:MCE family protein [Actinoplanes sp. NBRC 103695]|uniref:MCE family protein n=1 Tax=Actinoplanes sp. NBRC 103695 TaxID=3032202 RepID=UPI0024A05034|nr:MCE family protein [Actinoplanes sp. NBRC 103695]GLY97860.1 ABC transporter substrate-binding protein [Actinoplanes sp. NBRC 103695]
MSQKIASPLIKLTVFAAVTLVLTGLLAGSLGAFAPDGTTYRARFTDVTSVLPGDDIRIAGVKVGQVTEVRLTGAATAELKFTVDEAIEIPANVHATIRYRNLVGQRYVALTNQAGTAPALQADGIIPLAQTDPALDLTVLFNGFGPLFTALSPEDVNTLAYEIIQVFQGEAGTVSGLLDHTASLTSTLADRDAVISRVITNLNTVLATLDDHRDQLSGSIATLQQFVSGLAADRAAIGDAITNISGVTSATADLLKDARPDLRADIDQLGKLSGTLAGNQNVLDRTLTRLPGQYRDLTSTAEDGSWFNFFMCDFDGHIQLPVVGEQAVGPFSSDKARCTATEGAR